MKIRILALVAISVLCCLNAASATGPSAPLAIYFSFDNAPAPALIAEMQAEMSRILAPAGLAVTWRTLHDPQQGHEDFSDVVVFRFHGRCALDGGDLRSTATAGRALAQTQISDGRVLPFGDVACEVVRSFIAAAGSALTPTEKNAALGRALARVSAHEIYHMLTASPVHGREGITRSAHSVADLTAPTFSFAKTEIAWLSLWAQKQVQPASEVQPVNAQIASAMDQPRPNTEESFDSAAFGGR